VATTDGVCQTVPMLLSVRVCRPFAACERTLLGNGTTDVRFTQTRPKPRPDKSCQNHPLDTKNLTRQRATDLSNLDPQPYPEPPGSPYSNTGILHSEINMHPPKHDVKHTYKQRAY